MQESFGCFAREVDIEGQVELVTTPLQDYVPGTERLDVLLLAASINRPDEPACMRPTGLRVPRQGHSGPFVQRTKMGSAAQVLSDTLFARMDDVDGRCVCSGQDGREESLWAKSPAD
jgi:hypothetical protein